jgi:hypothetical protein
MTGIVARHNRGSQAIYEPWLRSWYDTGAQQPGGERVIIYSPASTSGALLLSMKLMQDMAFDRLQAVGLWYEPPMRTTDPNESHDDSAENVVRLLDEWMADESGYDEETWPELKAALERERLSSRLLFDD